MEQTPDVSTVSLLEFSLRIHFDCDACMSFRSLILILWMLLAGIPAECSAEDSSPEQDASSNRALVQSLVARLASPQFADRQKATEQILSLDVDAAMLLQTELEAATGETAVRLSVVLPKLRTRLFNNRLNDFRQNPSRETARHLPEWQRFTAIVGDDAEALIIFREILGAEQSLFAARMFSAKELSTDLEARSMAFSALLNGDRDEAFPIASCVALMLLGSDPNTRLIRATASNISDALEDPRLDRLVEEGVHADVLKAVIGAWINRPRIAADRPLLFSIKHQLPAGRTLACSVIQSRAANQSMYYALLCLAALGSADDLPIVESVMNSSVILWPPRGQTVETLLPDKKVNSRFTVRTGDVALTVAIHLRGRKPRDFGIPVIPSDETVYIVHSLGFENDETREAAFARYRDQFPNPAANEVDHPSR